MCHACMCVNVLTRVFCEYAQKLKMRIKNLLKHNMHGVCFKTFGTY